MNATAIIKLLGGPTRISKLVGTSVAAVSMWQNSNIPQDKLIMLAAMIEDKTMGAVTRKTMFPKTYKLIWPELD
jgi:DNA-binding transcriptional regulator YdaS (Cro superfamily)